MTTERAGWRFSTEALTTVPMLGGDRNGRRLGAAAARESAVDNIAVTSAAPSLSRGCGGPKAPVGAEMGAAGEDGFVDFQLAGGQ